MACTCDPASFQHANSVRADLFLLLQVGSSVSCKNVEEIQAM
jgi:hypothetical protein